MKSKTFSSSNNTSLASANRGGTHSNKVVPTRSVNVRNLPVANNSDKQAKQNNFKTTTDIPMLSPFNLATSSSDGIAAEKNNNMNKNNNNNPKIEFPNIPGPSIVQAQSLLDLSISKKFEGLDKTTVEGSFTPPDVSLAAGPDHVFEMVNTAGVIFTKDGSVAAGPFSLAEFFTPINSTKAFNPTDPKVMFDRSTNPNERWYAVSIDRDSSTVLLAVSDPTGGTTSDPIVPYFIYTLSFSSNLCMDYPTIGDSFDKVAVTVNLYAFNPGPNLAASPGSQCDFTRFQGVQYEIIDKDTLIKGGDLAGHSYTSNPDPSMFSLYAVPAVYGDFDVPLFMVTVANCIAANGAHVATNANGGCNKIHVIPFNNIGPPAISKDVPILTTRLPPPADQPDTAVSIYTGDNRIRSAYQQSSNGFNDIVVAFNDQCNGQLGARKACFRIVQLHLVSVISELSITPFQNFWVGDNIGNYFYPALNPTRDGHIGVIFGASRSGKMCVFFPNNCFTLPFLKTYPSLMTGETKLADQCPTPIFSGCHPGLFHNQFFNSGILFRGTVPATDNVFMLQQPNSPPVPVNLYGDYFGAAAFPCPSCDPDEIWLAGEFYKNAPFDHTPIWGTGISELLLKNR